MKFARQLLFLSTTIFSLLSFVNVRASEYDLQTKIGGATGVIQYRDDTLDEFDQIQMGGIPVALVMHKDTGPTTSRHFQGQIIIDLVNQQVLRQGVDVGYAWNLLGNSKKFSVVGDQVHGVGGSSVAFVTRMGLHQYSIASADSALVKFSGGVLEFKAGLDARYDMGEEDLGFEMSTHILSMPAGTTVIKPSIFEIAFYFRSEI